MYRASGRDVSNRWRMPDGSLVVTSRRLGAHQPVNIVTAEGQVSFGRATLSPPPPTNPMGPIRVTDVVPD
jgi:hypothetical protein